MVNNYPRNESLLQERLINKILGVSAIVVIIAYASALLRSADLGLSYRDAFQFLAVSGIVALAAMRQKFKTHHKALILITAYSIGAFAGVYSLGLLAGTILMTPPHRQKNSFKYHRPRCYIDVTEKITRRSIRARA